MKSEELDESPAADVHTSNETTNNKSGAAMKGPMSKQKNDGPAKGKPSAKSTTGTQVKAKVGTTGSRQPISSRPSSSQPSRVANAVTKKSNDQEQKASSKTAPRSGMSSHDKIMEKKMAARSKAVKENVASPSSAGGNGNQPNHVEKSGSIKALPTSKAVPKVKAPVQHCSTSAASKKPTAVAAVKLPAERPVKPQRSTVSRPNSTTAESSRPSASTVRKQPMSKPPSEHLTSARTSKPGVLLAGAKPEKLSAASSRKDLTLSSSQPKKIPSLEVSKPSNVARSTKTKLKPTEASAEAKHLDARLKVKTPVKSGRGVQSDTSVSKGSVGTVLQSTKTSKAVEKQRLSNRRSSTSRKSLSENVGKQKSLESQLETAAEVKTKEAAPTLLVAPSIEDVSQDPDSGLAIKNVSLPQEVEEAPCLSQAEEPSPAENEVMNGEPEASVCMGTLDEMEKVAQLGPVESSGQLNEVEMNPDQMFELELCLDYNDEIENIGDIVESEHDVAKVINTTHLNNIGAQQINIDENVTGVGEVNLNNDDLQVHVLPSKQICEKVSILPCSEGILSNVDLGALNPTLGSPSENVTAIKDHVVCAPTLEDRGEPKEPALRSSLEDESSPESNSNLANAEKVKLSMYEYSEEADTEESPPDELYPERCSNHDQDVVFKPCNLLVESCRVPKQLEHPVESENLSSGRKLGISPEDLHEDQGVSRSSTLSGPDLAGKSSSVTSTPEELKDYNSSSGVESKSEKLESADNCIPQRDELRQLDLVEQDLGIHLERGDYEPETLPADDLLEGSSTEPLVSSEDEDHSEGYLENVAGKTNQQGLEGIDNPVFEDKAANELKTETPSLPFGSPHFKPSALQAVDEIEELATAETPCSPGFEQLDHPDSHSLQSCLLSKTESQADFSADNQVTSPSAVTGSQSHRPEESPSVENSHPLENECPTCTSPEMTLTVESVHELVEDHSSELGDEPPSSNMEVLVADHPIDYLDGDLAKLQELTDDANEGCMQQQYSPLYEKNDNILTGIMNEGDKTLQTHCVPWITPLLPPILSTIYEVETAESEESRLEDDTDSKEHQKQDVPCLELIEDPNDRVLSLQIEPVEVVQQLINHTLLLSSDGVKLQSKVMVDKAELSKWTDLISPLDDSTASITSVTSFSPEDLSSSQGEWTVVELETHH